MSEVSRRTPTGNALFRPRITSAITEAVLEELAAHGYARLAMEAVARRAGVSKSALYRRWPSKHDMVIAVLSEFSVPLADHPEGVSLREDLQCVLQALHDWLTHPHMATILPDLTAEGVRNPALAEAIRTTIGEPSRALGTVVLRRAVGRGELPTDLDLELALDLLAAPVYWRLSVRHAHLEPDYFDRLVEHLLRALDARPAPPSQARDNAVT
ncbi:TetR/AcrR family transcriptional regulator [Streptomyces sp. NBC_00322]|uniref:TetR/AcrR family transcriptional regulator n=1 Tax=Streptomyces sp. NBC_00322 TaxID=2975712 RepID=UPI002E2CCEF7|nr:TetR/AcrR family transcriptional regulator [Streptomyces sp. NBC_00322]